MKVKRIIQELEKFDPEADVRLHEYYGDPVIFVVARANDSNIVWLETENDCDMKTALQEHFHDVASSGIDELDFYMDLLEVGVTVDCVRHYVGDESANHMLEFCKEHGLL